MRKKQVVAINPETGKEIWRNEIWDAKASSRAYNNQFWLLETGNDILICGVYKSFLYLSAFQKEGGKCTLRFNSGLVRNH